MRGLVDAVESTLGSSTGRKVLDIGCNDGSLLSIFAERGASTYGIEPTGAARDARERGHVVAEEFFDEAAAERLIAAHGAPDVVTFTNVFAHIEDLQGLIRALKALSGPTTAIVIENHYLGAILERNQFDTFYHEHPRTYSYTSFAFVADALGMRIAKVEFPQRYGGNIRVFLVPTRPGAGHDRWDELNAIERTFGTRLARLADGVSAWRIAKTAQLQHEIAAHGPMLAKAFPGRAAIPIKLLGIDERHISAVYEKPGSGKIGHYVPGTRIPILSDDDFVARDGAVLNLAWHISGEITAYLRARGYTGRILDIISPQEF